MVTLLKANQSLRITSEFEMDVIGTVNDKPGSGKKGSVNATLNYQQLPLSWVVLHFVLGPLRDT